MCCDVRQGRLSIRRAAESYQVPRSTLSDGVTGRLSEGSHSGPSRNLTDEEEAELVHFWLGLPVWVVQKPKKMFLPLLVVLLKQKEGLSLLLAMGGGRASGRGNQKRCSCHY